MITKEKAPKPLSDKQAKADRQRVNALALPHVPAIVKRLLPKGHVGGQYWQAQVNRPKALPMSLSVDLKTGAWLDFHNSAQGYDIQGLVSYVADLSDAEAQTAIKKMTGAE